jgi:hypothetical protein
MEKIVGKTFTNEKVVLDGKEHLDCVFLNCTLSYSGGLFGLKARFGGSIALELLEEASSTLVLLQLLSAEPNWRMLIRRIIENEPEGIQA